MEPLHAVTLLETSPAPLALFGPELRESLCNTAFRELTGMRPTLGTGEPDDAWVRLRQLVEPVLQGGRAAMVSLSLPDGRQVSCTVWPLAPSRDGAEAALVIATPAPGPLRRLPSDRALHDLRGAVNNIGLAVEAVVRLPLDPAEREERLGLLRESVERLAALLEAFARREGAS
jgi:hypothetical protein